MPKQKGIAFVVPPSASHALKSYRFGYTPTGLLTIQEVTLLLVSLVITSPKLAELF